MQGLAAVYAIVVDDNLGAEFMAEGLIINDGVFHVLAFGAVKDHINLP